MDFSFGGRDFKVFKVDAMKQYHLVRRLGPILVGVLPAMKGGLPTTEAAVAKLSEDAKLDLMAKFATPIISGLSSLSDIDAEFVLRGLLSAVEMKQPAGNWARVASQEMIMMGDLELPVLMHLAGRAFMHNLSGFFSVLPQ